MGETKEDAAPSRPPWATCADGSAFRRFVVVQDSEPSSSGNWPNPTTALAAVNKRHIVARLTTNIVQTFEKCNPEFKYSESLNPRRFLTNPAVGVLNDGLDNANSDLILFVNFELVNPKSERRYIVKEMLGQGTFGQVAKCWDTETNNYVAVKVIKNQPAYYQQAIVEVSLLSTLNDKYDPDDKHHIVRMLDFFPCQNHLCIAFEMLGQNLYELLKRNSLRGLQLKYVQRFSKQILDALVVMKDAGIIHCDLKPENILITPNVTAAEIKVIDFGSACMEDKTVYSYIQSRYYRSPEVLLGYPYSTAIDMWSFGCIVAELYLGLPLFPGASEYDVLWRMMQILGGQPPDKLLREAKNTSRFFKHVGSIYPGSEAGNGIGSAYRLLTEEEFEARECKKPTIGRWYFPRLRLDDLIYTYPWKNLPEEENLTDAEKSIRMALVDFLSGLVEFDPHKRWSPVQALCHPFVTGEPFTGPYKPVPETPRIPVGRAAAVDHNPGGGHWLAAGLSPQVVGNVNRCLPFNSPHPPKMPFSYGSSYGSLGSHGSYNDNAGLASSYGSYGDVNTVNMYYSPLGPSGFNLHAQVGGSFLGSSPDIRRRPHLSHGNGIRLSPGSLGPMSLGVSPSQFTPPNSQMHISAASAGKYGPTSPARGVHGTSLGKAAAVGQYNRRRNWGHPPMSMPPHEYASQHAHGHHVDGISISHSDAYIRGHAGYSHSAAVSNSGHYSWRPQIGAGSGLPSDVSSSHGAFPASHAHDLVSSHSDTFEFGSSIPDPADWDPNYSDESLLQEDNSEVRLLSAEFGSSIHLGNATDETMHANRASRLVHVQSHASASSNPLPVNQSYRADRLSHASSLGESNHSMAHGTHGSYGRSNYFQQSFPSRHGQPFVQRFNPVNPNYMLSVGSHHGGQSAWPNYGMAEPHTSSNATLSDGISWGGRAGHSFSTTASHSRKDYGRIF